MDDDPVVWDRQVVWVAFEMVRRSGLHNMIVDFQLALIDASALLATVYDERSVAAALVRVGSSRRDLQRVFLRFSTKSGADWMRIRAVADVAPQGSEYLAAIRRWRARGEHISHAQEQLLEQWEHWNVSSRQGVVLTARRFLAEGARHAIASDLFSAPGIEVSTLTSEYTLAAWGVQLFAAGIVSERSPFYVPGIETHGSNDDDDDDDDDDDPIALRVKRLRMRALR